MIRRLGGVIPEAGLYVSRLLRGGGATVWCRRDERTWGASQTFKSEPEALGRLGREKLVFARVAGLM